MSAPAQSAPALRHDVGKLRRRRVSNVVVQALSWAAASIGIFFLAWIILDVVRRGLPAWSWDFFTELPNPPSVGGGGFANAIVGTLVITAFAALMGIPAGFFAGIYLAEYGGRRRLATGIRLVANVMMGIPSIIVGLFAYGAIVLTMGHFSGFAGSVALAIIMFPVMARTTEDVLNLVPNEMRESALALGIPRWKVTLGILTRAALPGILTAGILSVVRVSGETAPLLFTALDSPYWMSGLFGPEGFFGGPTANLTLMIYKYATQPWKQAQEMAWGGALLIIVAVLGMNVLTRLLFQRKKPTW